jgi:hypothetical protein
MMTHFNFFWVKIELCEVFFAVNIIEQVWDDFNCIPIIYREMILFGIKSDFINLFCKGLRCYIILSEGWSDRLLNLFL